MTADATFSRALPFSRQVAIGFGLAVIGATGLLADTPGLLRRATPASCYCGCSRAHAQACIKMCENPKRAARWGAANCAKPRIRPHGDNPGAGPRFPRSDRAERASR